MPHIKVLMKYFSYYSEHPLAGKSTCSDPQVASSTEGQHAA